MDNIAKVEAILDSYCTNKILQARSIDARYARLWEEIHAYLMNGGKRMRPRLVLLAHESYAKTDADNGILSVAAAWELLHACVLVHDDIIDRDNIRHGHPNIAGRYQSIYGEVSSSDISHYSLSASLIGGDLLLMGAYEIVNTAPISNDEKTLVQSYLNKALFTVAGGELIDTDSVLYPIDQSNPYAVAVHKTASYSLQLPLQCGAAMAAAPEEELAKLLQLGLHAGVAYQLKDDLLGVFGDSATTGKSNRSDIIEKKRTFLVQAAIKNLNESQANRLCDLFTSDHAVTDVEAEEIVELVVCSGAKEAVESQVEDETNQALAIINSLAISDTHKSHFSGLVRKLVTRVS